MSGKFTKCSDYVSFDPRIKGSKLILSDPEHCTVLNVYIEIKRKNFPMPRKYKNSYLCAYLGKGTVEMGVDPPDPSCCPGP